MATQLTATLNVVSAQVNIKVNWDTGVLATTDADFRAVRGHAFAMINKVNQRFF